MRRAGNAVRAFAIAALLLPSLFACANKTEQPAVASAPVTSETAPAPPAQPLEISQEAFAAWLAGFRGEALAAGITPDTFDRAMTGVQPLAKILELDRKQPESTARYEDYLAHKLTQPTIDKARQYLAEDRVLLREIGQHYGVQPRFILALWAVESAFGKVMGNYSVIQSLTTLAFDGRRSAYFKKELIAALLIVQNGDVTAQDMRGSWAGAMGQSQFMPSSYLKYAVDYDKSGRRDIWSNRADVYASIANYLSSVGWHDDQTWGRPVLAPVSIDQTQLGLTVRKSLKVWRKLGVTATDGSKLPARDIEASLIQIQSPNGPHFLVYDNYRTIMDWNKSNFFATAVGQLADRIGDE
jgi:membrane-bound lytic murein transglycosylase B